MRVTDEMIEAGCIAVCRCSGMAWSDLPDEQRDVGKSSMRAALEAALSHAAGQDGEQCRAASGWRCFHCNEVFTDEESATIHFGTHERHDPACTIDANEYRRMEKLSERFAEEDADCHRAMYRMQSEHQQALRRAEEAGYAKGVRDAEAELCALSRGVPEGKVLVPREMTPEMMKAVQMYSEVGAHICGSWTGAYGCIQELWNVAIAAQRKEGE